MEIPRGWTLGREEKSRGCDPLDHCRHHPMTAADWGMSTVHAGYGDRTLGRGTLGRGTLGREWKTRVDSIGLS